MYDNKKKKNTTDKKITYTLPLKRNDAKTTADMTANRNFAKAVNSSKGGATGYLSKIGKQAAKGQAPSITVKNPDYKKPANPVTKAKPVNNSPVVGQGNGRPLDNQQKKRKKGPSLTSLGKGTLKFKGTNT